MKSVEDLRALRGRDSGAAVVDGEADPTVATRDRDVDGAPVGGITACVVDQHARQAIDPLRGRGDQRLVGADRAGEPDAPLVGDVPEARDRVRGDLPDVHRDRVGPARLGLEAGEPEQVLDDPAKTRALAGDALDGPPIGRRIPVLLERQRSLGFDNRQRSLYRYHNI